MGAHVSAEHMASQYVPKDTQLSFHPCSCLFRWWVSDVALGTTCVTHLPLACVAGKYKYIPSIPNQASSRYGYS